MILRQPFVSSDAALLPHSPDRGAKAPFLDISTTHIFVNHRTPAQSKPFCADVRGLRPGRSSNAQDPNDQGHLLTITAPPVVADQIAAVIRSLDLPRRQVLLDARVVVMERGDLLNLVWNGVSHDAGRTALIDSDLAHGCSDRLLVRRDLHGFLDGDAEYAPGQQPGDIVAHPQLISQTAIRPNCGPSRRSVHDERPADYNSAFGYTMSELQKIESGTILTITPHVGDSNDIQLEMAVEVSDSIPKGAASDLRS